MSFTTPCSCWCGRFEGQNKYGVKQESELT